MQAAAVHPRPVRVIVELDPGMLTPMLQTLVQAVTTSLTSPPHPATPEEPADPAPLQPPGHDPPVVVSSRQRTGETTLMLPEGYTLGPLCRHGHRHPGTRRSLRRISNHKCRECVRLSDHRHKAARPPATAPVLVPVPSPEGRPALPPHLRERCFLSPILCVEGSHRYQGGPWTLRFLDNEHCCMCVAQTQRLAGD